MAEVMEGHQSSDGIIRDFCDGTVFRSYAVFSQDPIVLQVLAYYDEIELCNPLQSASKKNKVGCIFFSLTNIHSSLRSKLKSIYLVAVEHGIDSVQHYQCFLLLLRICNIATVRCLSEDTVEYLRVLIEKYLSKYVELYYQTGIATVKPKIH